MGPEAGETAGEGSPQESAGVPANARERARKKANRERLTFIYWWAGGNRTRVFSPRRCWAWLAGGLRCTPRSTPRSAALPLLRRASHRSYPSWSIADENDNLGRRRHEGACIRPCRGSFCDYRRARIEFRLGFVPDVRPCGLLLIGAPGCAPV